ncbi:hypothetical protein D3C73_1258610 [compost metagenome]
MHRQACLGSQNGFLPPAFKCQPDNPLGLRAGVDIGSIYEVDSLAERGMDNINRGLLISPLSERVGPEAQRRHLQPAAAQTIIFHINSLLI